MNHVHSLNISLCYEIFQSVMQEERKLGARLLDKPKQINFQHSRNNLCLTIEDLGPGWRSKVAANYQVRKKYNMYTHSQQIFNSYLVNNLEKVFLAC